MTAPTEPDAHPTPLRMRRWMLVSVGFAAFAGLLFGAVLVWSAPRSQIPVPGSGATPEEVVLAYIEAVTERDFDTANAIDGRPGSDLGRFSRPMRVRDVSDIRVTGRGRTAHVTFKADLRGTDASMDDGRQWWGYALERDGSGRWLIVDAGVA